MTKIPFSGNTQFSDWLGYAGRTPYNPFQRPTNPGADPYDAPKPPHPNQTGVAQMQPAATMVGQPSPFQRTQQQNPFKPNAGGL
jgi:hypothetical protein